MDTEHVLTQLASNAERISQLVNHVPESAHHWKPSPTEWSIVEVVNHLTDEERDDFRLRIDMVLHQPGVPLPPIDPEGWVVARAYNERALKPSLDKFLRERAYSIDWLRQRQNPAWDNVSEQPWGIITAGDFLASWLAHDFLHIRQLTEIHYQYTMMTMHPYQVMYAGQW
ncbi:MAG: DinB family protein [Chloroflexota bacterium]